MLKNYKILVVVVTLFLGGEALAQKSNVGIGTTSPDNSAILDIQSAEKGLLIPRMLLEQRNAIKKPANGLMIYQTNENEGFYFFDGKQWSPLNNNEAKSVAIDPNDWSFTGNPIPAGAFLGSTNGRGLEFKVNNLRAGYVGTGTQMFFGYQAGLASLGSKNVAFGYESLKNNTGSQNTAMGYYALRNNGSGNWNVGIGSSALENNSDGTGNVAIGGTALQANVSGNYNIAFGRGALFSSTGSNNVAIGADALRNNNGSNNVAFGYQAGQDESGSDKLYIANSATTTPLVYGDFAAKFISIGDIPLAKRDAIATAGSYGLLVKGGIMTEKVKVAMSTSADWADYVFEPGYNLMSLEEVEKFIQVNKHLPNVPSATEMAQNGLDVSVTTAKLMEKIEELTLYVIELKKEINQLKED